MQLEFEVPTITPSDTRHFDILIIGAGLSGIGAAVHLKTSVPHKRFHILEARHAIGGTWDLFRYPGVRSDSDMYTLGYRFRPWVAQKAIADGPDILEYVRDTARAYKIDSQITFGRRATSFEWSTEDSLWTVTTEIVSESGNVVGREQYTCNVVYSCVGYYSYAQGYQPDFPGVASFKGELVHPQKWPETLDYRNKRVVVIGSGATAITLVPAMAKTAAHVTMLQRSPTYVVSRPARDGVAQFMRTVLPERMAYTAIRWKNVAFSIVTYTAAKKYPGAMKRLLMKGVREQLSPDYAVDTHFSPRYNPWDQRMCLVPDADLFASIRDGRASVVTAEIETFTSKGIRLTNGDELEADIVVSATGLKLQLLSGAQIVVDGREIHVGETIAYKGMMLSDIPNMVSAFGYTNASWTLKCDLTAEYTCRLLKHADARGYKKFTPRQREATFLSKPVLDFSSGYVTRALRELPSQGPKPPWRVYQNYLSDLLALRYGRVDDGVMEFV